MSLLEILLTVTGLIYVILASNNRSSCWIFGIISSAILAYVSMYDYKLYADAGLNVFYVIMGMYGLWIWYSGDQESDDQKISYAPTFILLGILVLGFLLSILAGYLLTYADGAFATYWDALTTVFGVLATWMLIQRYVENWYMWIVIDLIMIWLYVQRGGYLTAGLFLVYCGVAIYGAYRWRKRILEQDPS